MPQTASKSRRRKTAIARCKQSAIIRKEPPSVAEAIEKVLIVGDLTPLSTEQRLQYYKAVCGSLGLNPLTRPFDYIAFKGDGETPRMTLYARRDCTDQLRKLHGIDVTEVIRSAEEGMFIAEAKVRDRDGKTDSAIGVVPTSKWDKWKKPMPGFTDLTGVELANARMKAETKAKRRATLSICGLGFLDQSELDTVGGYCEVTAAGRIIHEVEPDPAQAVAQAKIEAHAEGRPITEDRIAEPIKEIIQVAPWTEGRVSLTGVNGLSIIKAEIEQQELADMGIMHNTKEKITHMPSANVVKFSDRAEKCGVAVEWHKPTPEAA